METYFESQTFIVPFDAPGGSVPDASGLIHPTLDDLNSRRPSQLKRYMLHTKIPQLLLLFALGMFCFANTEPSSAQVITIEGHVRTAQGDPLNDVQIDRLGKTDETGYFNVAGDFLRYWNTLMFDKKGFVPQVIPINPSTSKLEVALEREKDSSVTDIPDCSAAKVSGSRFVGNYLRLTVPKELKFKKGVEGAPSFFEIYDYETDSKEAADLFDKILDGVCLQSNDRP